MYATKFRTSAAVAFVNIENKIPVYCGDFRATDTVAFQASHINQPSRRIAGRVFKHAAGIFLSKRLRFDFLFVEGLHPFRDCVSVAMFKLKRGPP